MRGAADPPVVRAVLLVGSIVLLLVFLLWGRAVEHARPAPAPVAPTPVPSAARVAAAPPPPPEAPAPGAEAEVDLALLRARLPDNRYWDGFRATAGLHGKVLSGTATDDEIRRHFEERRAVSEDAIAFARAVLDEYGDRLPERERGLYELAITMHVERLAEIPRELAAAWERKREQEERRAAWRGRR